MKEKCESKEYSMSEAVAYCILGYRKYVQEGVKDKRVALKYIIKFILEMARDEVDTKEVILQNKKILDTIPFSWKLTLDDFFAYATCVFYVLTNREIEITPEKIVAEFLSEVHSHHPRRTLKEAKFILDELFLEE